LRGCGKVSPGIGVWRRGSKAEEPTKLNGGSNSREIPTSPSRGGGGYMRLLITERKQRAASTIGKKGRKKRLVGGPEDQ